MQRYFMWLAQLQSNLGGEQRRSPDGALRQPLPRWFPSLWPQKAEVFALPCAVSPTPLGISCTAVEAIMFYFVKCLLGFYGEHYREGNLIILLHRSVIFNLFHFRAHVYQLLKICGSLKIYFLPI